MQKICGVSIHPRYAGWFALRGVILFRDVLVPELEQKSPPDVVSGDRLRVALLEQFNFHWKNWSFRDIVPAVAKYSPELQDYLTAPASERLKIAAKIRENAKLTAGDLSGSGHYWSTCGIYNMLLLIVHNIIR